MNEPTPPEAAFLQLIRIHGFPMPVREHEFHPERKWRFDFCWPDSDLGNGWRLAVEVEGLFRKPKPMFPVLSSKATESRSAYKYTLERAREELAQSRSGGHRTVKGFLRDCEKYTAAIALQWVVIRIPSTELWHRGRVHEPAEVIAVLRKWL